MTQATYYWTHQGPTAPPQLPLHLMAGIGQLPLSKTDAEQILKAALRAWEALWPWSDYPDVKPVVAALEAFFDSLNPKWRDAIPGVARTPGTAPTAPTTAPTPAQPSLLPPPPPPRTMGQAGVIAYAALKYLLPAFLAAGAAIWLSQAQNQRSLRDSLKRVWERVQRWKKKPAPRGDPPVKGPSGTPIAPSIMSPFLAALAVAAAALVAGYGLKLAVEKVPTIPDWLVPALALGGLGIWALFRWYEMKER